VLGDAGFAAIELEEVDEALYVGPDLDEALDFTFARTWIREALDGVAPETAATVTRELRAALAEHAAPDGAISLAAPAWLVTARRP
jgi:hypothetical protein